MSRPISKFVFLTTLLTCLSTACLSQSATPQGAADLFVKAWNTHDMKAFDRLFTKDAIWVPVAESMDKGRAMIVKDFAEAHKTWAKTTAIKRDAVTVLQVTPDVATLFFHGHFLVDGKVVPEIDRALILVVTKKSGKWQIAAGQLTKQHDGA